jgi:hypothetical protein
MYEPDQEARHFRRYKFVWNTRQEVVKVEIIRRRLRIELQLAVRSVGAVAYPVSVLEQTWLQRGKLVESRQVRNVLGSLPRVDMFILHVHCLIIRSKTQESSMIVQELACVEDNE